MPFAMALPPVAAGAYVRVRQDTSAGAGFADFRTIMPLGVELVEPADRVELAERAIDRLLGSTSQCLGGGLDVGVDVVLQAHQRLPGAGAEVGALHTDA